MQLDARFPLTPALSPGEREDRRPIRIGTVWCVLPKAGRRSKAGSPLRSAPALHRVELNRSGLGNICVTDVLNLGLYPVTNSRQNLDSKEVLRAWGGIGVGTY